MSTEKTQTATATSRKEVIAETIRETTEKLNKLFEEAYESDLIIKIDLLLLNEEEVEKAEELNEFCVPHLEVDVKIFEQV
jgi:hypothetical protein